MPWISHRRWSLIEDHLAAIHRRLDLLTHMEIRMTVTVADIHAKVAAQTSVIAGVSVAFAEINQRLKDALAANDPVALQAVADLIDQNTAQLATNVVVGTVAAGEVTAPVPAAPPVAPPSEGTVG